MISYTKKAKNVNTTVYYANETNDQSHNENLMLKQFLKNSNAEANVYHTETKSNAEKSETRRRKCKHYSKFFEFDNKLHQHIRRKHDNKQSKRIEIVDSYYVDADANIENVESSMQFDDVIEFDVKVVENDDLIFRAYRYVTIMMTFQSQDLTHKVCINTECTMSLIDKQFLSNLDFSDRLKKAWATISIIEINERHLTDDYLLLNMYISKQTQNRQTIAHIRREVHVIEEFKINLLIEINIMTLKRMIIYSSEKQLVINSCKKLTADLHVATKNAKKVRRVIVVEFRIMISSHTIERISIHKIRKKLSNRDYLFELELLSAYAHVANVAISAIYVQNDAVESRVISTRAKLDHLVEFEEQSCFQINVSEHFWAAKSEIQMHALDDVKQTRLNNEINVYETLDEVNKLRVLIEKFVNLWIDSDITINLSKKNWMIISLNDDWNSVHASKIADKVYSMSERDRKMIDEKFDKLHREDKMKWSSISMFFDFSIFVV